MRAAPTSPPSTVRITPVIHDPALDDRYMQAPPMSSPFPILPSGIGTLPVVDPPPSDPSTSFFVVVVAHVDNNPLLMRVNK